MGEHNVGMTRRELSDLTGINVRTIEYWTKRGLLQAGLGGKHGLHRYYTVAHVERIEEIKALKDQNRTLADMVDYFDPLEDDDDE